MDVFRAGYAELVAPILKKIAELRPLSSQSWLIAERHRGARERSVRDPTRVLHPHRGRMPQHRHGQPELRDRSPHSMAFRRWHVRFTVLPLSYIEIGTGIDNSRHHRHGPHHTYQSRSRRLPAGLRVPRMRSCRPSSQIPSSPTEPTTRWALFAAARPPSAPDNFQSRSLRISLHEERRNGCTLSKLDFNFS